ncbi:probable rRNA maturation factor [Candidatus Vecturithrix granuli]|uniref:Endoribonuclease YbeY n=1 Tax=Vecturithrix granuli TaxID=1499967 RepID=A0A081BX17_VECG1|nr:probable rRNA maturation factor [Candidatus Vecturithrix granuli]
MDVLISDLQDKIPVDLTVLKQMALTILAHLQCDSRCELSVALVDDQEMQRLNREYRGIDHSTDVLSFALQEAQEPSLIPAPSDESDWPIMLGDVILSTETTQRQAREHGHSFERELYFLVIHGILHLIGHDHHTDEEARIMEDLEQTLLSKLTL